MTHSSGSSMARSFCENDVGNDVVEESSTDDDMLGGMSKDNNKFDTDSGERFLSNGKLHCHPLSLSPF